MNPEKTALRAIRVARKVEAIQRDLIKRIDDLEGFVVALRADLGAPRTERSEDPLS